MVAKLTVLRAWTCLYAIAPLQRQIDLQHVDQLDAHYPPEGRRGLLLQQGFDLLMNRGRIVADGPKRIILVESKLSELFGRFLQLSERDGYYNLW